MTKARRNWSTTGFGQATRRLLILTGGASSPRLIARYTVALDTGQRRNNSRMSTKSV